MDAFHHGGHRLFWLRAVGMTATVMKKCRGESCSLRAACARYYIAENAAGWLDVPERVGYGCMDFLAFGRHLLPPQGEGRDGDGAAR